MNSQRTIRRKPKYISSRNNAYQHLQVIKSNRSKRTKYGEVVVEGVLPINLCMKNNLLVKQIFFIDYNNLSQWAKDLIDTQSQAELFSVEHDLMCEISDNDIRSEVIILAQQPKYDINRIKLNRTVILDRPSNPGNFGAIVRTCDAFNIDAVFISGHGIDPYDPKSITASRGTIFSLPVIKLSSNSELETTLGNQKRDSDFIVYGSSAKAGEDLKSVEQIDRFALMIGNETTGMSQQLKEMADVMITIPILGDATSLNMACATSILVYELTNG